MKNDLFIGLGNAKLGAGIGTFTIPSGHTCPGARACLAKVVDSDPDLFGHVSPTIVDGKHQVFRCFSATAELRYPNVRRNAWSNYKRLQEAGSREGMEELLTANFRRFFKTNPFVQVIRIHVGGDFFSQAYFDAWLGVCRAFPDKRFYGYTKSIPFWEKRKSSIPDNLTLTASLGGKWDLEAMAIGKTAAVVFHEEQAEAMGLEIDHDDTHALNGTENFALLIHSTQPAGTEAAEALQDLKQRKVKHSYGKNSKKSEEKELTGSLF